MTNNILGVVRIILLLLAFSFIVLFGYKFFTKSELNYEYLVPILGLVAFYFITKPKVK